MLHLTAPERAFLLHLLGEPPADDDEGSYAKSGKGFTALDKMELIKKVKLDKPTEAANAQSTS